MAEISVQAAGTQLDTTGLLGAERDETGTDEKGGALVRVARVFHTMSQADIAARARFFAAMRSMSDADYAAGKGLSVDCTVREDPRVGPKTVRYTIGGSPRAGRTYAVMEAELVAAVRAAHS
ncbi:hypothetical protein [Sutterella sp.]|uniref:hypothetical protein n=1 Tax=Sutterella sp. TaxID=1981025 RepID=UPI0026DEF93A|nr:hypothetical protein [Sutterella sp.]MDO5530754.1 hypothetical protein [Sutterella sp.]